MYNFSLLHTTYHYNVFVTSYYTISYCELFLSFYDSATEYERRLDIFAASLMDVEEHRAKNLSWIKAINKFSDMTVEEFKSQYGGTSQVDNAKSV